jgi:hypothetical protein
VTDDDPIGVELVCGQLADGTTAQAVVVRVRCGCGETAERWLTVEEARDHATAVLCCADGIPPSPFLVRCQPDAD